MAGEKRHIEECPVCCESFTKASRKPIECAACGYNACQSCAGQYLISTENACCMKCSHPWNYEFLQLSFPRAWIDGVYKKHRRNVLFETEKALLPASQHLVHNYRHAQALQEQLASEVEERKRLRQRLREIDENRETLGWRIHRYKTTMYTRSFENAEASGSVQREQQHWSQSTKDAFICKCPDEECRGFLSKSSYRCGTCSKYACNTCLVLLGDDPGEHTCDPGLVETINLLRSDTRSCPRCKVCVCMCINSC